MLKPVISSRENCPFKTLRTRSTRWIGLSERLRSLGSGTASVSVLSTIFSSNTYGYPVDSDTFSFTGITLGPGTYYLTLQNAVLNNSDDVYWDENDGAGVTAYESADGELSGSCSTDGSGTGTCAESFQILGTTGTAPEPGTFALGGMGLLMLAGALRRFRG